MISYWEKIFYKHDFGIIGGGLSGLSTAISIKEKFPDSSIVVLEKEAIPASASTRNAGFACFGSLTELISDKEKFGRERMLDLVEKRWKGLEILKNRFKPQEIDFELKGGFELLDSSNFSCTDQLEIINYDLKDIFDSDVFSRIDFENFPFDSNYYKAIIKNDLEGQLHSGKLLRALRKMATDLGIELFYGLEVLSINEKANSVDVECQNAKSFEFDRIVLCSNAWTSQFLPEEEVKPGRGSVMISKKMDLGFEGSFHVDEGYVYFRDYDSRLIIGGARNVDFENEETFETDINPKIKDEILSICSRILPDKKIESEMWWSGIMGFGSEKYPILKKFSEHIFVIARLSGMGVALASLLGEQMSELIKKN